MKKSRAVVRRQRLKRRTRRARGGDERRRTRSVTATSYWLRRGSGASRPQLRRSALSHRASPAGAAAPGLAGSASPRCRTRPRSAPSTTRWSNENDRYTMSAGFSVAVGVVHRPLHHLADAHDADFRVVDDRRRDQPADVADRRDRERAALQVVELALAGLGVGAEPLDLGGDRRARPSCRRPSRPGTISPLGAATATPMWYWSCSTTSPAASSNVLLTIGTSLSARADGLHEERQVGELHAGLGERFAELRRGAAPGR